MCPSEGDFLNPIKDVYHLQKLLEKGYVLKGPRQNPSNYFYLKDFLEEDIILFQKIGWKAEDTNLWNQAISQKVLN